MKRIIRSLVIGNKNYFGSWTEYRQVILSGQYGLIAIVGLLYYCILDIIGGFFITVPVYCVSIILIASSIKLHRGGRHCLANSILYPTLIFLLYLVTSSEALANGGAALYLPITIGAFASFDYKHRKLAIMIAGFACLLFLATYFDFSILPWRDYSKEQIMVNMLINFVIAFPTSLLAVYMLIKLSHANAKQLVQSNQLLKKSNEELDRFIYSTSHDLRAPLASVLGLINLSEKSSNMDEHNKYLAMMKTRINALEYFIKDITDYSRNSRTEVNSGSINLYDLTNEIWDSLRFTPMAENIHFEIGFDYNFIISSDLHRLRIILANLISNAIRYHDTSKEHKYIRVNCKRTENSFILSVADNGQGIAPEYHSKIFQMFYRANETSTGSGLGLYIVKEAIAKLSGDVELCSELRLGSTFTFRLPF